MSPSDSSVLFQHAPRGFDRGSIRVFAGILRDQVCEGKPFECLITDDVELQRLNREFLGKDYATDVLSFPAAPGSRDSGQLAISWQRANAQAREFGHTLLDEIRILMLHGALHLIGLDHERDRGGMRRTETRWRKKLGLPTGLIERARA